MHHLHSFIYSWNIFATTTKTDRQWLKKKRGGLVLTYFTWQTFTILMMHFFHCLGILESLFKKDRNWSWPLVVCFYEPIKLLCLQSERTEAYQHNDDRRVYTVHLIYIPNYVFSGVWRFLDIHYCQN